MMLMIRLRRKIVLSLLVLVFVCGIAFAGGRQTEAPAPAAETTTEEATTDVLSGTSDERSALQVLAGLVVKGRAPKTDYAREQFDAGWATVDACDMRNYILARDMQNVRFDTDGCTVLSGILHDPYTAKTIQFQRGKDTSRLVQIDHVVALSDAWQKGAQQLDEGVRAEFANDPLNLLAVDGPANMQKSDSDAASWLPTNKDYRCRYVARQIAVKHKYSLWVTLSERDAMQRVLQACPDQRLPEVTPAG